MGLSEVVRLQNVPRGIIAELGLIGRQQCTSETHNARIRKQLAETQRQDAHYRTHRTAKDNALGSEVLLNTTR